MRRRANQVNAVGAAFPQAVVAEAVNHMSAFDIASFVFLAVAICLYLEDRRKRK